MADRFVISPFTGRMDDVGPIIQIGDSLYYFYNGNRYKITAVIDNPVNQFFLLEDGSSYFLLEDGGSKLVLEVA